MNISKVIEFYAQQNEKQNKEITRTLIEGSRVLKFADREYLYAEKYFKSLKKNMRSKTRLVMIKEINLHSGMRQEPIYYKVNTNNYLIKQQVSKAQREMKARYFAYKHLMRKLGYESAGSVFRTEDNGDCWFTIFVGERKVKKTYKIFKLINKLKQKCR